MASIPAVKEANDLPSFVKRFNDQQSELGKRTSEFQTFKQSLEQAGKLAHDSPDKYQVKLDPNIVPETLRDEALISEFKTLAHKTGMSQAQADAMAGLYQKIFETTKPILEYDHAESEKAVQALAQKAGIDYEVMKAKAAAGLKELLDKRPGAMDKLEASGLANDPDVLWAFYELGMAHQESHGMTGGEFSVSSKSAMDEANDIVRNPENPKYKQFWAGDQAVNGHVLGAIPQG